MDSGFLGFSRRARGQEDGVAAVEAEGGEVGW